MKTRLLFNNKNGFWLQCSFKIGDELKPLAVENSRKSTSRKSFSDVMGTYKRRVSQSFREDISEETLLHAAKEKLAFEGFKDHTKVVDYIIKYLNEISQIKNFCEKD